MLKAQYHRGPDSGGMEIVPNGVMGHRRLAIIDTSSDSNQPMRRHGVTIVYNGECYNFRQQRVLLEQKGHVFTTSSDTEVVLAMYLAYGEDFVRSIRGIFAFVLHDSRNDVVLAARDALGVKPLYWTQQSGALIIGSEIKGMLASGLLTREIDHESLCHLVAYGCIKQPRSILSGVSMLMPGHLLKLDSGVVSFRPYWQLKAGRTDFRSYDELLEVGREKIMECLNMQLVSDVELGAFLSSGIDSSLMAALLQQCHGNIKTFTVGIEDDIETYTYNEREEAEDIARHLGCEHVGVTISGDEVGESLPRIARDLDHPTVDGVNSWVVSKAASEVMTVALSGTGGDELFAGYHWFRGMPGGRPGDLSPLHPLMKPLGGNLKRQDPLMHHYMSYLCFTHPEVVSSICPLCPQQSLVPDDPLSGASAFNRMTGITLSAFCRDQLLPDIDSASMAHSLEVRVPFLDVELLEFALTLPEEARMGNADPVAPVGSYAHSGVKRLLLDMGRDLLPDGFASRPKRGFTLPFDGWLKGKLKVMCADLLSEETVRRRGFFNPVAVQEAWHGFLRDEVLWYQVWILMMVELWASEVLEA